MTAIAKTLNAEGAPCAAAAARPAARRGRRPRCATVLLRPLYRGEIVWNRTRKRDQWGRNTQHGTPDARLDPRRRRRQLRIVSEELWTAAHRRIDAARATDTTHGRSRSPATRRSDSKYLLSGLRAVCVCGGGLHVAAARMAASGRPVLWLHVALQPGPRPCAERAAVADATRSIEEVLADVCTRILRAVDRREAVGAADRQLSGCGAERQATARRAARRASNAKWNGSRRRSLRGSDPVTASGAAVGAEATRRERASGGAPRSTTRPPVGATLERPPRSCATGAALLADDPAQARAGFRQLLIGPMTLTPSSTRVHAIASTGRWA